LLPRQILRFAQDDNSFMELLRVLATLSEPPTAESRRLAELVGLGEPAGDAEWTELFAFQLPPYASIYLSPDGRIGGEARDRVAGFWRALGLVPPSEPDHLPVLLAFLAELVDRHESASTEDGRARLALAVRACLHEHLMSWLPFYLAAAGEIAGRFHREWSELLAQTLAGAVARFGTLDAPPAALRESAALPRPESAPHTGAESGGDAWLEALLSPATSGVFFPRAALRDAARELGLGERLGERRLTLRTLLAQDAPATLDWLAGRARRAAASHLAAGAAVPGIARHWWERASSSAALLDALAAAGE
jgi:TorA maturation chaperone TorD